MTDDAILKKVLDNLGQIATETGKETVKQAGQVTESIITGKELLGDIKPLSEEELAKKKAEDERKVQEEMKNIPGRNVESEIKQISDEKKREEEEKERQLLEQVRQQREAEEAERQQLTEMPGNAKREAAKTQFAPGKRKKQQPDPSQMSQTSEFKGGKID
jgi:hypothetical protein